MTIAILLALAATIVATTVAPVQAQWPATIPRIGYPSAASAADDADRKEAFTQDLR